MIAEQRLAGVGAIASERAGAIFGLDTLRAGIQDQDDNTTRFLIVTRAAAVPDFLAGRAANKTTIVFTLPNTPGALFKALSVFALRDIDVTKIESRPTGRPWEYLFHMDLAVGRHELPCARALSHLAEFAPSLKVLGSYPGVARSADTAVDKPSGVEVARRTETGEAPGDQGARRADIGNIQPTSNAERRDASPVECSGTSTPGGQDARVAGGVS
jgi:hypothetical protein